jgi:zinc D-Ala-D-Ala carboxypeptidase
VVLATALLLVLGALAGCAQPRPPLDAPSGSPSSEPELPVPTQRAPSAGATSTAPTTAPTTSSSPPTSSAPPSADIDDPAGDAVVVNKLRPLQPQDYVPELVTVDVPYANKNAYQLRPEASAALSEMFAAYTAETGLRMQSQSAYRSYVSQKVIYNRYASAEGIAGADTHSARPGYSEHQTGLALDINALPSDCSIQECFANTTAGEWLAANSWRYGFVLRYPKGSERITGYTFEPWHYRYLGVDLAQRYHATGARTVEEFFGLPPAPDYAG